MNKRELTREEIIGLIAEFRSEVKKNTAKIEFFNEKIEELTLLLKDAKSAPKNEDVAAEGCRRRKKEEKPRNPYPLSKWDKLILEAVKENGRPMFSKDIYSKVMAKAVETGITENMDVEKQKAKINQCLVKLSGRRADLMKMKYGGRGYAYCITKVVGKK